jgi:hypothetical protein
MAADPQRLDLDSIIADPVRCALRKQLKNLGQRLYSLLGSTGLMATSQTKSPSSHRTSVAEEMVQAILMERHRAGLH